MSGLPPSSRSTTALLFRPRVVAGRTRVHRAGVSARNRRIERRSALSEELFRDAVVRQRRRADRFEEPFALVLISFEGAAPPPRWRHLVDCLSRATSDSDLIGWFKLGEVLGIVRALDGCSHADTASAAESIQQEVSRSLPPDDVASCSVRAEVYSPHGGATRPVVFDSPPQRQTLRHIARDTAKRALDIVGSLALLLAFSPILLCVAALVRYSSKGPVFFRQQRVGRAGQSFWMLKFRTMQVNADPKIHQQYVESFIQSQQKREAGKSVVCKIMNDPRVTPLGHFLRRSSLDELPQFWNVLIGEMSLVGPRPPLPYEVAKYKCWHRRRVLEVKPGITGLWQVTGRSSTTFDEMVRLDIRYARTYSLWTDLKILIATPRAVLSGKGAY